MFDSLMTGIQEKSTFVHQAHQDEELANINLMFFASMQRIAQRSLEECSQRFSVSEDYAKKISAMTITQLQKLTSHNHVSFQPTVSEKMLDSVVVDNNANSKGLSYRKFADFAMQKAS
jgi:hypothetical protein